MNRSLFIKVFTVDGIKEIEGLQSSVIPCRCHQPYRMLVGHGIAQALTSIPCQFENIPLGFHSSEIRDPAESLREGRGPGCLKRYFCIDCGSIWTLGCGFLQTESRSLG